MSAARGLGVAVLLMVCACEPAFTQLAPVEKTTVPLTIFPNNGRRGDTMTVIALAGMPSPSEGKYIEIVDHHTGPGVLLERLVTEGGVGCSDERVSDLLRLLGETTQDRFPVCMEMTIKEDALVGDGEVVLEFVRDGADVISRATFSVLPALVDTEQPG